MKKAFFDTIYELAAKEPRLQFIKGDTAYIPEYQASYPNQYLDVGIAEQNMIGVAAGMALEGNIPITYSIINFATMRCLEQIRNDVAYHNLNVKIVSCGQGFDYGNLGATHHATEDIAIMRAMPNMTVFCPCDACETVAVTRVAVAMEGPCFIRNGHGGEPRLHEKEISDFQIGRAYELLPGDDIAILVTGSIASDALEAARWLRERGHDAGVYSFPTVKPLDTELVKNKLRNSRVVLTVEEHTVIGGLGSAVAEVAAEISYKRAKFARVGLQDTFSSEIGARDYIKKFYKMDAGAISEKALRLMEETK